MSVRSEREWSTTGLISRSLDGLVRFLHHAFVEVFAHLPGHLLHEPRHALWIALVEVAQVAWVGQRLEARLFRFGGGDAGDESCQPVAPAVLAAGRLGVADVPDEKRGALAAGVALVFINRHSITSPSCLTMLLKISGGRQPSSYYNGKPGDGTGTQALAITTGGDKHGHSDREPQRDDGPSVAGRNRRPLARSPGRAQRHSPRQDDPGEEPASQQGAEDRHGAAGVQRAGRNLHRL